MMKKYPVDINGGDAGLSKCIPSTANRKVASPAHLLLFVTRFANAYISGSIATPNSVPTMRQPNGFMPKIDIPA